MNSIEKRRKMEIKWDIYKIIEQYGGMPASSFYSIHRYILRMVITIAVLSFVQAADWMGEQ